MPCMPGTRQWILNQIHSWLDDPQAPNILWLGGSPGAGKSTIASTLVSQLAEMGRLGSSFFFKRGDIALSDPAAVWRTVAFDLAQVDPVFAERLVANLKERKMDVSRADVESHFKYMIEDPLIESWKRNTQGQADDMDHA
jgi:ABC-type transport system involved in cytochrome bd biosynthesis fused ATPase/permease subunit